MLIALLQFMEMIFVRSNTTVNYFHCSIFDTKVTFVNIWATNSFSINQPSNIFPWKFQYIGEAGQLQYIDEWGLCAVQFACDKRILRLPVDSLIKVRIIND